MKYYSTNNQQMKPSEMILQAEIPEAKEFLDKYSSQISQVEKDDALVLAAGGGDVELMKILVEHGANVNGYNSKSGLTPLVAAAWGLELESVQFLIDHQADVNLPTARGSITPLFTAIDSEIEERNTENLPLASTRVSILLFKNGADPNVPDEYGNTPLSMAIQRLHTEAVTMFQEQSS